MAAGAQHVTAGEFHARRVRREGVSLGRQRGEYGQSRIRGYAGPKTIDTSWYERTYSSNAARNRGRLI